MTTLVEFRTQFILPLLKRIPDSQKHVLATEDVVPLCGAIMHREKNGFWDFVFYLAAEDGEI
ncbi:MAG: hypothetical protein G01um101456_511, partial [Parcubacteria group bacterium Gr01-1014_56]